jgi:D-aminoacyl-tRNA deacylase
MILLVSSAVDMASQNIAAHILKDFPFKETMQAYQGNPMFSAEINGVPVVFVTLKGEAVYAQALPADFPEAELVVFISRHRSQSGMPTLSVHTPGNFGAAELGGAPRCVSVSPANAMCVALKALSRLQQEMGLDYAVSYEGTHHGPSLDVPAMFVELGSSPPQWSDLDAARAVAHAAMEAIAGFHGPRRDAVLGVGGTHYNQKFTAMALAGEAVFGHMIPKYAVHLADAGLLRQCIEKTLEPVDHAVLDWKGIRSDHKSQLLSGLEAAGLAYVKV